MLLYLHLCVQDSINGIFHMIGTATVVCTFCIIIQIHIGKVYTKKNKNKEEKKKLQQTRDREKDRQQ